MAKPNKPGRPPSETSLHGARTRKENALAEMREIECAKLKGDLVDKDELLRELSVRFARMVAIIENSKLSEDEKFDLRTELAAILETKGKP